MASARAAEQADNPWDAVTKLVWQMATFEAEDRGMVDILAGYDGQSADTASMAVLMKALDSVVARAQAAGTMRQDVSAEDVMVAVCGIGKMMRPDAEPGTERWRRLVSVILDGLRRT